MSRTLVIGARGPSGTTFTDDLIAAFTAAAHSLGHDCVFIEAYPKGVSTAGSGRFDAVLLYLAGDVRNPAEIIRRLRGHTHLVLVLVAADARTNGQAYHPHFALHCRIEEGAAGFFAASEQQPEDFQHRIVSVLTQKRDEPNIELSFRRRKTRPPIAFIAMPYERLRRSEFQTGVEAALTRLGWHWSIGDHFIAQSSIHDAVCRQIDGADVMIANLTGANLNVIYETGIASRKNRVLLRRYDDRAELPLLLRNTRIIVPFNGPIDLAQTLYHGLRSKCR